MSEPDKKNIIVGAAQIFIGTSAAVKPPAVAATSYAVTVAGTTGWLPTGYTTGGLEISYEPTFNDVVVDQSLDSARVFKTSQQVMLNTTFAEATLTNLLYVWALPDTALVVDAATVTDPTTGNSTTGVQRTLTLVAGDLGDAPQERQIIAIGNGPEQGTSGKFAERTYYTKRSIITQASAHALRRDEAVSFPASFRILPDDTTTGLPYGTIVDRVHGAW